MASLSPLPAELADRLCQFLPFQDLKNTLLISWVFHVASERASGAFAGFKLTEDNAERFVELYSGRRWEYLRHLRFRPQLPTFHAPSLDSKNHCRESAEELRDWKTVFTRQIMLCLPPYQH